MRGDFWRSSSLDEVKEKKGNLANEGNLYNRDFAKEMEKEWMQGTFLQKGR